MYVGGSILVRLLTINLIGSSQVIVSCSRTAQQFEWGHTESPPCLNCFTTMSEQPFSAERLRIDLAARDRADGLTLTNGCWQGRGTRTGHREPLPVNPIQRDRSIPRDWTELGMALDGLDAFAAQLVKVHEHVRHARLSKRGD